MTPDSGTRRCREHPTQEDGSGRSPGTGRSLCRYLTPAIISPAFHCVQSSDRGRPVTPAPGPAATVPTGARCEPYYWHRRTAKRCDPWHWHWARNRWRPAGEISELADAHLLQILDGCPHLLRVPRRPVVAGRQPRHSGAAAHGDETDCETLRSVVLALGQEPLRQGDRRKLVHKRTVPSDSRTAARCSTSPRWPARAYRCSCRPASDCWGAAPRPPARTRGSRGRASPGRTRPDSPGRSPRY